MIFNNIRNHNKTPQCERCMINERLNNKLLFFEKTIKPYFIKLDLILITENYIDAHQKLEFQCKCKNHGFIIWANLSQGQIPRCKKCQLKYSWKRGKDHISWNPNRTDEERKNSRYGHDVWQKRVKKRDNYTCQLCGAKESKDNSLSAHHKYNWRDYPDKRFDLNNGVALCRRPCHIKFHQAYGNRNNTSEQFNEFKLKISLENGNGRSLCRL